MLDIAREGARRGGFEAVCTFEKADFITYSFDRTFDYSIAMGFMD